MARHRGYGKGDVGAGSAPAGLAVLTLAGFACVATEVFPVGLLPRIATTLEVRPTTLGLIVSAYAAAVALLAVPLMLLIRRTPGKLLLVIAVGGFVLCNVGSAVAPGLAALTTSRVLGGVAHALFWSVCIGLSTRLASPGRVGRSLALVSVGPSAGFAFGIPWAALIEQAAGWRIAFVALAVLLTAVVVLIVRLVPDVRSSSDNTATINGDWMQLGLALGANTMTMLGHYTLYTFVTLLLLSSGASPRLSGAVLLAFGVVALGGIWLARSGIDARPRRTAVVVLLVLGLGLLACGWSAPLLPAVIATGAVWNLAFGPVTALFQSAAVRVPATSPELAGAWVNTTSNVGIAAGSAAGSLVLAHASLSAVATTGAVAIGGALVLVLFARRAYPGH